MIVWLCLIGLLIARIDSSGFREKLSDLLCMHVSMYVYMCLFVSLAIANIFFVVVFFNL